MKSNIMEFKPKPSTTKIKYASKVLIENDEDETLVALVFFADDFASALDVVGVQIKESFPDHKVIVMELFEDDETE